MEQVDYKEPVKCPILDAPERSVHLSDRRVIECVNCPVTICFEEINLSGEAKMRRFLKEVQLTIAELKNIEGFIIHEYRRENEMVGDFTRDQRD